MVYFESIVDKNLSQYSYLVGCQQTGGAIIIDPARDIEKYFQIAEKEELEIIAATETHIHADFLSGARELGMRHNVTLYLSDEGNADWKYQYLEGMKHKKLQDGSVFSIGNIEFEVIHTPGHTPESISFLLKDNGDGRRLPMGIFTGDFVFVGDVGRPDLLEKAANVVGNAEIGARQMYQSLQKFKKLPDYLLVWPGHGSGSACGKSLGAVPMSTVGYEKTYNWALKENDENTFVKEIVSNQSEPPKYFTMMKTLNKRGPSLRDESTIHKITSIKLLYEKIENPNYIVIDTRSAQEFAKGHLPGVKNIPFDNSFTTWSGWLIDYDKHIIVLSSENNIISIRKALQSIGLDQLEGYMTTDFYTENIELESYNQMLPKDLQKVLQDNNTYLIDVRNKSEWDEGHIEGAHHLMLGVMERHLEEIPSDKTIVLQCRTGHRSAIGASLLQANGIKNVINLSGGIESWINHNLPIVK